MSKTILETVVGSTLHGTSVDDGLEDLDLMAIVLESYPEFIGFKLNDDKVIVADNNPDTWVTRTKPDHVRSEAGDIDHVAYGLKRYLRLALKSNPTVLLPLFAPPNSTRVLTEQGQQLRELTPYLLSRGAYSTFRGYMHQQFERLIGTRGQMNVTRPELISAYGYDTKYAGHILRLGYQGQSLLLTGRIPLPMPDAEREQVIKVRTGGYPFERITEFLKEQEAALEVALRQSILPETPDFDHVNKTMIRMYSDYWRISREQQQQPEPPTAVPITKLPKKGQ